MISVFVLRDMKIKYAQTKLRSLWFIVHPIINATVYVFFFQYIFNVETSKINYPVYVLSGIIGWNLFASILTQSVTGIDASSTIIRKIYFPKLIIPISKSVVSILEGIFSFILLCLLMILLKVGFSWKIILLPLVIFMFAFIAIGISAWMTAFSFKNKDIIHGMPYLMNLMVWFTPVFMPMEIFPEFLKPILYLNPIAALLDIWRSCLFDAYIFDFKFIYATLMIFPISFAGIWMFAKNESKMIDFI